MGSTTAPTSTTRSIVDISSSAAHPLPATRSIVDIISEFNARSEMAPDWGSLRRDVSSFKPNPPQEKRLVTKGEGVLLVNQETSESQREENSEGEELEEGGRKRSQDG